MSAGSHLRPHIIEARDKLAAGRLKLLQRHAGGTPGIQVCNGLTDLFDSVVLGLVDAALDDLSPELATIMREHVAIVPHGGYGRRDAASYSDVDLMLLHSAGVARIIPDLARRLMVDICDAGMTLGFSLRTPAQACNLSLEDPKIFTSLAESRLLAGSENLFAKYMSRLRRDARRKRRALVLAIAQSRREERMQYGETVYLLEPNIKRSRGGLRDLQLIRWAGFACFGESNPRALQRAGALSVEDHHKMRDATEFLLRIRNDLHFHAGRSQDVLDRAEQLRIAELYAYEGGDEILPVERFMQEYFQHTSDVRNIAAHFIANARTQGGLVRSFAPLLSHQVEGDFRVGPVHIGATRRGMQKLRGNLVEVLRLMDLANLYSKRIDPPTWKSIRHTMLAAEKIDVSPEASRRFLSLISQPGQLGTLLRRLHELRVLEKIIPGFSHARCLLQFNEYHKYTVDEHSIRAVEAAASFLTHPGLIGDVYRSIDDKRILHLALLVHDLGKGYPEDHSEVGERMAADVAQRLTLTLHDTESLKFLVRQHLVMAHLAFRRDTSDESVVVRFAVDVGSPDLLKMLFVLTCADLASVGPKVLNHWKLEVLSELYGRTMRHLAGELATQHPTARVEGRREKLHSLLDQSDNASWLHLQIDCLPASFLDAREPEEIIEQLSRMREMKVGEALAWGNYLDDRKVVEFSIGTDEHVVEGIFHRLTGVLSSHGLEILAAEIFTLDSGLVMDRFFVHDPTFAESPPAQRIEEIAGALCGSLTSPSEEPPVFRRLWHDRQKQHAATFTQLPTRVRFDNRTSDQYTIIDVFAHDRLGLLYIITRQLYQLGVSVSVAKIGTYLDQVVDVFYATDSEGQKIKDEKRLAVIRQSILEAIGRLEKS